MKKFFIFFIGFLSLVANADNNLCLELQHTDNTTRNICERNNKNYLILEFIMPGCGPCQQNVSLFKDLEHLVKDWAHSRIISIKSLRETIGFINNNNIQTETAIDDNYAARQAYGVRSVPTVLVLDQDNNIIYRHVGKLDSKATNEIKNLVHNN